MPVGGYMKSGIGRENGIETLQHYTQTKSVLIELGDYQSPLCLTDGVDLMDRK